MPIKITKVDNLPTGRRRSAVADLVHALNELTLTNKPVLKAFKKELEMCLKRAKRLKEV